MRRVFWICCIAAVLVVGAARQGTGSEPDEGLKSVPDAPAAKQTPASNYYDPVEKQIEGWTIVVDPKLLEPDHRDVGEDALRALANHLQRIRSWE